MARRFRQWWLSLGGDTLEKVSLPGPIFTFVEYKLYNYKSNKALIASVDERRKDILMRGRQANDRPNMTKQTSNITERKAVALILEEERAALFRPWVESIDDTLDRLDPVDRQLVELKYFDALYNDKGIIRQLPMSERSYYRRRAALIYEFARAFGLVG